jgi:hypothetical protein
VERPPLGWPHQENNRAPRRRSPHAGVVQRGGRRLPDGVRAVQLHTSKSKAIDPPGTLVRATLRARTRQPAPVPGGGRPAGIAGMGRLRYHYLALRPRAMHLKQDLPRLPCAGAAAASDQISSPSSPAGTGISGMPGPDQRGRVRDDDANGRRLRPRTSLRATTLRAIAADLNTRGIPTVTVPLSGRLHRFAGCWGGSDRNSVEGRNAHTQTKEGRHCPPSRPHQRVFGPRRVLPSPRVWGHRTYPSPTMRTNSARPILDRAWRCR